MDRVQQLRVAASGAAIGALAQALVYQDLDDAELTEEEIVGLATEISLEAGFILQKLLGDQQQEEPSGEVVELPSKENE